jgi:hypothetical protein
MRGTGMENEIEPFRNYAYLMLIIRATFIFIFQDRTRLLQIFLSFFCSSFYHEPYLLLSFSQVNT